MDMPKPSHAHSRLHRLAGQWGGEETVHPAPHDPGGSATAFLNNRIALDGLTVVQEYEQYREGRPTYSGHGVFWFDPVTSQYVMTWFDSTMGAAFDFRGDFDGDVLRLANALPGGGFVRATFDCGVPGEYVFLMEVSMDGESWAPSMEGAYGLLNGPTPTAQKTPARTRSAVKHGAARKAAVKRAAVKKPVVKKAAVKKAAVKKAVQQSVTRAARKAARGKK